MALSWLSGCGSDAGVSRELGARCERHSDCGERCLSDGDGRYPDGLCSQSCDSERDCPADAVCADTDGGVCLFSCQEAADCAFLGPAWGCVAASAKGGDERDEPREVLVCLGV